MRAAVWLFAALCSAQSFEVATIKLRAAGATDGPMQPSTQAGGPGTTDPTRIMIVNRTLHRLLIDWYRIKGYELSVPEALDTARYDIVAKVPPGATRVEARRMMQNLLSERLKLRIRRERRTIDAYALVVSKGGLKLNGVASETKSTPAGKSAIGKDGFPIEYIDPEKGGILFVGGTAGAAKIVAVKQTMAQLISMLNGQIDDRPVLDMTGLTGKYDFSFIFGAKWQRPGPGGDVLEGDGPTLFQALEKLGLKLESRRIPVEMLIVDGGNAEPVEN
jgi:uncharacterized protein (TIGR03435 family)